LVEILISSNKMSLKEIIDHTLGNEKNLNCFALHNYLRRMLFKPARLSTGVCVTTLGHRPVSKHGPCYGIINASFLFLQIINSNCFGVTKLAKIQEHAP